MLTQTIISQYETAERKRRAALEISKNAESGAPGAANSGNAENMAGMKREVWVRPSGHRTTTFRPASRDEQLASMTSVEVIITGNKIIIKKTIVNYNYKNYKCKRFLFIIEFLLTMPYFN